jgi:hypothetical protein
MCGVYVIIFLLEQYTFLQNISDAHLRYAALFYVMSERQPQTLHITNLRGNVPDQAGNFEGRTDNPIGNYRKVTLYYCFFVYSGLLFGSNRTCDTLAVICKLRTDFGPDNAIRQH